jgi:histidinol-phosphate/aromatic aminotransferase/cobyric acid decarboxylase-like protein
MSILSKTRFAHESNALSNAVAEHLLDNFSMVEQYNRAVISCRGSIKATLTEMGIPAIGSTGNFLLLDLATAADAKAYVAYLRERQIYIKGPWAAPWDRYATITLGPIEVMQRFIDATRSYCSRDRAA